MNLTINDFSVGDIVRFGRDRGQQTKGEVVKVNRKNLKIRQLEQRGRSRSYPVNSIWTVSPELCTLVNKKSNPLDHPMFVQIPPAPNYPTQDSMRKKVGKNIRFHFRGREYEGRVIRANAKSISVEPLTPEDYQRFPGGWYVNYHQVIID